MVRVHRLDGSELVINVDLIETVEATPDTIITLTTGKKVVVRDSVDEVVHGVIGYKQAIALGPPGLPEEHGPGREAGEAGP